MKRIVYLLLALAALTLTSCGSAYRTMREPNVRFELNSNDYILSDQVTGEATVTRIFGIDWARLFGSKTADVTASLMGGLVATDASYAIYDLLQKNPGYDFVMYPQVEKQSKGFLHIVETTKVKVTARLGKLKDQED